MRGKWLISVRRCHLYLSVFFAPLLLLFVITGWAQTVGFDQASIMKKFSEVHMEQYYPTRSTSNSTKGKWTFAGQIGTKNSSERLTWPAKWLVVAMCIALIISISLGLVLAFTVVRNRIPVLIALVLGIAVPTLLLALPHLK